jgi:hypothetical protein
MGLGWTVASTGPRGRQLRAADHNNAIRQITDALKGPVADIYRTLVPALSDLSGQEFYDTVIASPDLLHGCLLIFRKRRDAFAGIVVDAKGRVVNDDFVHLRCGRTVHDIIAMIVRTHAKQHFRTTLGGDPNDPKSRSGRLYQAMNEYLIHEWQIPLVRHYAPLPVAKVRELGPRLLEYRTVEDVQALGGIAPVAPPTPVAVVPPPPRLPPAEPALEDNSRERDFWWETLNDPQVRAAMGSTSDKDMRELTAAFCHLGEDTRSQLLAPLGLSLYQAAVLLGTCYRTMGRAAFAQIFGKPGNGRAVAAFTQGLKRKGVGSRVDLRTLERETRAVLAAMPRPSRATAAAQ